MTTFSKNLGDHAPPPGYVYDRRRYFLVTCAKTITKHKEIVVKKFFLLKPCFQKGENVE